VLKVAEQESVDGDWFLMDWQVCKDRFSEVHLRFLFKECVAIAARHGAGFLNLLLSDRASKEAAIQSGFSLRDVEDGFFLWVDESVSPDIFNSQQWFLSYADTDEVT
ncbi:MAG TPA: hypothetical protein VFM32_01130, partial [Spongiibacteraceae bacterium]|nr:hypothetical protein [Spongiibacteraceae bacterium]